MSEYGFIALSVLASSVVMIPFLILERQHDKGIGRYDNSKVLAGWAIVREERKKKERKNV